MSPASVLARLHAAGVTVLAEGPNLRLRGLPRDGGDALVALAREHKPALLSLLSLPRELHQLCPGAPRRWSDLGPAWTGDGIYSRRYWHSLARAAAGCAVTLEPGADGEVMVVAADVVRS